MLVFGKPLEDIINGLLIIIVTVCGYFGIKGGGKSSQPEANSKKTVELAGAVIDNRAVDKLAIQIARQNELIEDQNKSWEAIIRRIDRWFEMQEEQKIDKLEEDNRRLREEIARMKR